MKRLKTICRVIFLAILLFLTIPGVTTRAAAENTQFKPLSQESQLSPDDWKIEIDEKKSSNEFGFIQKNLDSSNLADNGQFLISQGNGHTVSDDGTGRGIRPGGVHLRLACYL